MTLIIVVAVVSITHCLKKLKGSHGDLFLPPTGEISLSEINYILSELQYCDKDIEFIEFPLLIW